MNRAWRVCSTYFCLKQTSLLEKLDEILIRTESDTLGEEDVGEIFRIMHTVKGSAAMMGLTTFQSWHTRWKTFSR